MKGRVGLLPAMSMNSEAGNCAKVTGTVTIMTDTTGTTTTITTTSLDRRWPILMLCKGWANPGPSESGPLS